MKCDIFNEISVVLATENDTEKLLDVIKLAEGELLDVFFKGCSQAWIDNFLTEKIKKNLTRYSSNYVHVAKVNGIFAGAIFSFPAEQQTQLDDNLLNNLKKHNIFITPPPIEAVKNSYYLSSLAVLNEFRGKGIAKILIEKAEEEGKSLGFKSFSLLVSTEKEKAKNLYIKYGYKSYENIISIGNENYLQMLKEVNI